MANRRRCSPLPHAYVEEFQDLVVGTAGDVLPLAARHERHADLALAAGGLQVEEGVMPPEPGVERALSYALEVERVPEDGRRVIPHGALSP